MSMITAGVSFAAATISRSTIKRRRQRRTISCAQKHKIKAHKKAQDKENAQEKGDKAS
jgi:hypothetical protein